MKNSEKEGVLDNTKAEKVSWNVDNVHSKIGFSVRHMVISEVTGRFNSFKMTVVSPQDEFETSQIEVIIDANSIETSVADRNNHLKSDDFFNVEKFPEIKFKSKSFVKIGEEDFKLTGDLTIRDVTKEINLDVVFGGQIKDPWGNIRAGFKVSGSIDRYDYNVKFNSPLEAGGFALSKKVTINCDLELVKSK